MNITFLIGNGFDLNLGLKTSYKNFLDYYSENNHDPNDNVMKFKKFIDKKEIKKEILWVDAEKEFLNYTSEFDGVQATVNDYRRCHLDICSSLGKYLEQEEKKLSFKLDGIEGKFSNAIGIESLLSTLPLAEQETLNDYKKNIGGGFNYNFLTFNYTRTIDEFVGLVKDKGLLGERRINNYQSYTNTIGKLLHVHGYTNQYMVFGGNDESQIKNIALFENDTRYKKQFIKRETNLLYQQGSDNKAFDILRQSDLVYIFGMSIGETDALWWDRICTLLHEKNNMRVIIHVHKFFDANPAPIEWCFFMDDFKNQFLKFSNFNDTIKERIKNRIYVTNGNIFSKLENLSLIDYIVEIEPTNKNKVGELSEKDQEFITNKELVESYQRTFEQEAFAKQ